MPHNRVSCTCTCISLCKVGSTVVASSSTVVVVQWQTRLCGIFLRKMQSYSCPDWPQRLLVLQVKVCTFVHSRPHISYTSFLPAISSLLFHLLASSSFPLQQLSSQLHVSLHCTFSCSQRNKVTVPCDGHDSELQCTSNAWTTCVYLLLCKFVNVFILMKKNFFC